VDSLFRRSNESLPRKLKWFMDERLVMATPEVMAPYSSAREE